MYYVILVYLILVSIIMYTDTEKKKKKYLFLTFSILFILSSIRGYSVGTDTSNYVRIYDNLKFYGMAKFSLMSQGFCLYWK